MPIELFGYTIGKKEKDKDVKIQTFARPDDDDGALTIATGGVQGVYMDTEGTSIKGDVDLINRYRDMALQAEVENAIDDIVNEAIVTSKEKPIVNIKLENLNVSDNIKDKVRLEFKTVSRLLDFQNIGHDLFKRWYIDGRLYYHVIVNEKNPKNGIYELRVLDPRKVRKVKEVKKSKVAGQLNKTIEEYYVYNERGLSQGGGGGSFGTAFGSAASGIKISPDTIVYCHSGMMNSRRTSVLSFLHKAIKPLNQLRMLEDALVIYRISRAPERRIFYVDVGNLPKMKAEQYMRDLMSRYKNKLVYDAGTGEIRDDRKHMSMLEDYWMPRAEGGRGTEITTLPGGQNLGDIEDVLYFQKKLYKSLGVPISRLESEASYTIGRATEISRDEVKFTRFVNKLQNRFTNLFDDLLERQLSLKGIMNRDDWKQIKNEVYYEFESDSHFAELKRSEIMQDRMNLMRDLEQYVGKYYSHEFIRRNILMQNDDEIISNDKQISNELEDARYTGQEPQFNSLEHDEGDKELLIENSIDRKLEEKFDLVKKDTELKETINDILSTINKE